MPFTRDRYTWLAYFMLGYFAYIMAALGPLMPFLRAELNLSYTIAGLHVTVFALGMTIAGALTDRLAERFGRAIVFWGGGLMMAVAAFLFINVPNEFVTISSSFFMGMFGSFLQIMIQSTLAERYGHLRSIALSEANFVASLSTALVPLAIGFGESSGIGWRVALWVGIATWVGLRFVYRHDNPPATQTRSQTTGAAPQARPMPRIFWIYWAVIFFSVAVEWCIGFWGADFLENGVGLERVAASTLMAVFLGAMTVGRLIGSRLTRRVEAKRLLTYAGGIVMLGFPLFWLAQVPILNIIGLFISGLGIANLYPLTVSITTSVDPERSNTASARSSMGAGLAVLIMPQILGAIADRVGISGAFGVAAILVVCIVGLTIYGLQAQMMQIAQSQG